MIRAVFEVKDERYVSLDVRGHALSNDYGKDLICASAEVDIRQTENRITVVDRSDSDTVQDYFELVIMQLKTIEVSYGDFIKVERK